NDVVPRSDAAGAPQEAEKKSDLPDNDDVAADGVTSVVGPSTRDEAVSDKAGGGAAATGPKSPDAADDAQGAVDPPPREDDAVAVRGGWEADMEDAPPPIHGNNTAAADYPSPPSLACRCRRRRANTQLSGCVDAVARRGDSDRVLRGPHSAVGAREKTLYQLTCLSQYIHIYDFLVCMLCTGEMLYALFVFCVGRHFGGTTVF
ncbi:hypothetical protein MOQ_005455, partial [Trypanosoma cruzi marinkellei]